MIGTYIVYNFIIFGATISAYLYEKSDNKINQIIFLSIAFFIPFFFLAIRYNIGTDYPNYVVYFEKIASGIDTIKEPGYELVNQIIAYYNLDVQWVFIFFGFFYLFFAYKALPKKGFAFGVFLFIAISYLYDGFSAIRQGVAVMIMAYAMKYIYSKEFKKYLFWSIMAMSFHLASGFLLLITYFISNKNFNKYFLMLFMIFAYILVIYTGIIESMLNIVVSIFPKYAWYLQSEYMQPSSIGSGLGILFKIFIALIVIFFKDKIGTKYPESNIVINLYVLYILFLIFRMKIMIFGRMEHMFIVSYIFSVVYFLNTFKKMSKIFVSIIILSIYYLIFMKYIITGTKDIDNSVHISPYQTILERR